MEGGEQMIEPKTVKPDAWYCYLCGGCVACELVSYGAFSTAVAI